MAVDHLEVGLAQKSGSPASHILVGGAVEAVAADVVILIVLGGNGVPVSLGGHGHMESGVEHGNLGSVGHNCLASPDTHEVSRVVEGSQGDARLNGLDAGIVNDAGIGELHAAMEHPVTHGINLVHGLDDAFLGVLENLQHSGNGLGVGGHGNVLDHLLVAYLVGQTAVDVDTLTQALGRYIAGLRVHQLILQAGAAGVDNQNVHWNLPP